MWDLIVFRLNYPYSCFSSRFCFSSYCSVCLYFVSSATRRWDLSFIAPFNVVPECSNRFIPALFNAGESPSFFYTCSLLMPSFRYNALRIVIKLWVLWSICLSSSLVYFKNGPMYLTKENCQMFIFWWCFYCRARFNEFFSFLWSITFIHFLSSPLDWWFPLPIFPITRNFPFLQTFRFFFWFDSSIPFVICLFSFFQYEHGTFFSVKFQSFIQILFSYSLYLLLILFHFLQTASRSPCKLINVFFL